MRAWRLGCRVWGFGFRVSLFRGSSARSHPRVGLRVWNFRSVQLAFARHLAAEAPRWAVLADVLVRTNPWPGFGSFALEAWSETEGQAGDRGSGSGLLGGEFRKIARDWWEEDASEQQLSMTAHSCENSVTH